MKQLISLQKSVYQAICVIGESISDNFSDFNIRSPMFEHSQDGELKTSIFLGLCANAWPELKSKLLSLPDIHENGVSLQNVLNILVPFESSKSVISVRSPEYMLANICDLDGSITQPDSSITEAQSAPYYM